MRKEISNNSGYREGHYSNGDGHRKRSQYWDGLRRLYPAVERVPVEIAWMVRRAMLRDPKNGK